MNSVELEARRVVETTLVPHTAFEHAVKRIEQCFNYQDDAGEPICAAILGESRTGKSRCLEESFDRHRKVRTKEGLNVPILRVKTPSKPTVKGLAELMLNALDDPRSLSGTENAKTLRLQKLMIGVGTRMVMIDEFQHFYDKGSHKIVHHVADWLKVLVDDCRIALVVAGLPTCRDILAQNEQLSGRFLSPMMMPRFDWVNYESRGEFEAILEAFYASISRHFSLPRLDTREIAFRCYCGTGGLIGYLTKFLRQAVWNALDARKTTIELSDLEQALDEAVWTGNTPVLYNNPFSRAFNATPTESLLSKVKKVGTRPEDEELPEKPRRSAGRRRHDLSSVLKGN